MSKCEGKTFRSPLMISMNFITSYFMRKILLIIWIWKDFKTLTWKTLSFLQILVKLLCFLLPKCGCNSLALELHLH
ncbi:hypothetical protein Golax_010673 [Gossypium laxum]|uniref:Uncharacterized protein n=1 Tax=Gossypium laxum TaxID=34288 RepID=A0A7J8ZIN5_9ROSI|nr:hypothetical protein [Gossypium laxum]